MSYLVVLPVTLTWKSIVGLLEGRRENNICFQDAEQVMSCRDWGVKICIFPLLFETKYYSFFFFNFQFSLSQLHLVWWIRGPLWPWWVSRPERMGPLIPRSNGLCPTGGERTATLRSLGTRAVITGWRDAAALVCSRAHLGLFPPRCRLHWSRLRGGKLANICCLAVLRGLRLIPIPEILVLL